MDFVGIKNFKNVFSSTAFHKAIINTLIFTVVVTFVRVALGMILAVIINRMKILKSFFRTVFFLPVVASIAAISLVWVWIFEPTSGIMNYILNMIGLPSLGWLKDRTLALGAIMIATIWKDTGFSMVFYLAGLGAISPSLYEAAEVDGASPVRIFFKIQIPMLMSTTVLVSVTGIIGYIQMFDQVMMMGEKYAGPNNAVLTAVYLIYDEAFVNFRFGTAAVVALVVFLLTFVFSIIQMRFENIKQ
jgi:multiple sugar transport system permease protein